MTTAIAEEKSVNLAWDAFLDKQADLPQERNARDKVTRNLRQMIDAFRRVEWPNIKRELAQHHHWEIEDGLEPHWVAPGYAVYWQEQVTRNVVNERDAEGNPRYRVEWASQGWQPTAGAPANNASQIAGYLGRGLRLRPPHNGKGVEAYLETASLSEVPQSEAVVPQVRYACRLPHPQSRRVGVLHFNSWRAYMQHCIRNQEMPTETPPQHVLDAMARYKYWCHLHGRGFNNPRLAEHHRKLEMRKPGKQFHLSVKEMQVVPSK